MLNGATQTQTSKLVDDPRLAGAKLPPIRRWVAVGAVALVETCARLQIYGVARPEGNMVSPDRKRELEQMRWIRDHPEEAAAKYGPNDIRRQHPELLRS